MSEDAASKLECDLVMRGGITSGIVYPRAIAKLAETYNFRSIGGTSAGAIAAAAAAAAAYGAKHGQDRFQTDIRELPGTLGKELKGKTRLERLFQPQPSTRRLFRMLISGLGRESKGRKAAKLIGAAASGYGLYMLAALAVVFVLLLCLAFAFSVAGAGFWLLMGTGAILGIVLAGLSAVYGMVRDVRFRLPENFYGLCSGSNNGKGDEAGVLPLTDWLHDYFQTLANRRHDRPLTFGDLWGTRKDTEARDIELVLMTTNVTRGVSQRLPFLEGSWGQLFFNEEEFRALFPKSVIAWMKKRSLKPRDKNVVVPRGYYALPGPGDLPILLGARMSLSFPFLLSAVPLYAGNMADRSDDKIPLQRCWFSDGGLTSNFPLHFFDTPLPSRPTFGINLVPASVKRMAEIDNGRPVSSRVASGLTPDEQHAWSHIYMPARNSSGISSAARFNEFDGIVGFFSAMFDTARNWADTELTAMPGYRDRIVHVSLSGDEGGLNLNMPGEIIERIGKRGEKAGELLAGRFAPNPGPDPQTGQPVILTWENHRWIRYRSLMAGLELTIKRLRKAWTSDYWRLINRPVGRAPSYQLRNKAQREFARKATKQVLVAAGKWTGGVTFDRYDGKTAGRSPRPKPVLRMMPPGSNDPRVERAG